MKLLCSCFYRGRFPSYDIGQIDIIKQLNPGDKVMNYAEDNNDDLKNFKQNIWSSIDPYLVKQRLQYIAYELDRVRSKYNKESEFSDYRNNFKSKKG